MNYKKLSLSLLMVTILCGLYGAYTVMADYGYLGYFNLDCNGQTGDICMGTSNFYMDYSSGYVGIGTSTPSTTLDVVGNTELTGTCTISDNIYMADDKYIGISGAERIIFDTAGDISVNGANFGIGTTSPDYNLEINDNDAIFVVEDTSTGNQFYVFTGNTASAVGTLTNTPLQIRSNSSIAMTIDTSQEISMDGISSDGTGKVVCIKADGNLGTCTSTVGAGGTCTCV